MTDGVINLLVCPSVENGGKTGTLPLNRQQVFIVWCELVCLLMCLFCVVGSVLHFEASCFLVVLSDNWRAAQGAGGKVLL